VVVVVVVVELVIRGFEIPVGRRLLVAIILVLKVGVEVER